MFRSSCRTFDLKKKNLTLKLFHILVLFLLGSHYIINHTVVLLRRATVRYLQVKGETRRESVIITRFMFVIITGVYDTIGLSTLASLKTVHWGRDPATSLTISSSSSLFLSY